MITRPSKRQKLLVGISGKRDSAVAAALMKNQGYEVIGVYFQMAPHGSENVFKASCAHAQDPAEIEKLCKKLDIAFHLVDLQGPFQAEVVDEYLHSLLQYRSPTPCLNCTRGVIFHALLATANQMGVERVATGHAAQILSDPLTGTSRVYRATERAKDQSFLLFGMAQADLKRVQMPLGALPANVIQRLGKELGFTESSARAGIGVQCMCTHEERRTMLDVVRSRMTRELYPKGVIRTLQGEVVGEHEGMYAFYVGQSRDLPIQAGKTEGFKVVGFDMEKHAVIVGHEKDLLATDALLTRMNWLRPMNQMKAFACGAKLSSSEGEKPCTVTLFENASAFLHLNEAERAMTRGQPVALYEGNELIGGGFVDRVGRPQ